jgi:hypothetical protein
MIKAALEILANMLGIIRRRQDLNNAPNVQKAKEAQQQIDNRNEIEKTTAARDADAMRRGWSD